MSEKQIVKDKIYSAQHVAFRTSHISKNKPIKFFYKGLADPIFTIKANHYDLSTNKPHTTISLKHIEANVAEFLANLDEIVPKIAYENRKEWFTSDLFTASYESFVENYRKNVSEYGFSIFLGVPQKDELPVNCFIRDLDFSLEGFEMLNKSSETTRSLTNSFQELAWGNNSGQVTILAQVTGLWIKEESYGLSWKVLQILYRRKPSLPNGCQVFTNKMPNFVENLLAHTWQIPSDEADEVELPDDDEPSILTTTLKKASSDTSTLATDSSTESTESATISEIPHVQAQIQEVEIEKMEETSGIDPSNLPSKPYNPLLETDD